jgi:hypothetical protein
MRTICLLVLSIGLASASLSASQQAQAASIRALVTDQAGVPVPGATVSASGPSDREGTTGDEGILRLSNVRAGTYRLRVEADGFITLEREVVVRARQPLEVDITLRPAPQPAAPPEPEPTPEAPSTTPSVRAESRSLSLPQWVERNFIARGEPSRYSVIAEAEALGASILQVREPLIDLIDAERDQVIYVIAGTAVLEIDGRNRSVEAGWLVLIPRGTPHSITPRGRNPLVALTVVAPGAQE